LTHPPLGQNTVKVSIEQPAPVSSPLAVAAAPKTEVTVALRLHLEYPSVQAFIQSYAVNLSAQGMFLPSTTPLQPGERLRFEVVLADALPVLRGEAEVHWTEQSPTLQGLGVRFVRLDTQSQELLTQVLTWKAEHPEACYQAAPDPFAAPFVAAPAREQNPLATTAPAAATPTSAPVAVAVVAAPVPATGSAVTPVGATHEPPHLELAEPPPVASAVTPNLSYSPPSSMQTPLGGSAAAAQTPPAPAAAPAPVEAVPTHVASGAAQSGGSGRAGGRAATDLGDLDVDAALDALLKPTASPAPSHPRPADAARALDELLSRRPR